LALTKTFARALMLRMLHGGEGSPALAQRLLAFDPLCEEAYRFLIRHNAASGDLASAQGWFNACTRSFGAAGIETSLEIRALIKEAETEIARSSANSFQIVHPANAAETTQWLRASLACRGSLHRPPAQILPEIADRPSIVVLPFVDLTESPNLATACSVTSSLKRQRWRLPVSMDYLSARDTLPWPTAMRRSTCD
jgi:hypothetical protein